MTEELIILNFIKKFLHRNNKSKTFGKLNFTGSFYLAGDLYGKIYDYSKNLERKTNRYLGNYKQRGERVFLYICCSENK